jgi:hypothetical protein
VGGQGDGTVFGEVDVCGFLDFGESCEREGIQIITRQTVTVGDA